MRGRPRSTAMTNRVIGILSESGEPLTAYEVAARYYGRRSDGHRTWMKKRLEWLESVGLATQDGHGRWRPAVTSNGHANGNGNGNGRIVFATKPAAKFPRLDSIEQQQRDQAERIAALEATVARLTEALS